MKMPSEVSNLRCSSFLKTFNFVWKMLKFCSNSILIRSPVVDEKLSILFSILHCLSFGQVVNEMSGWNKCSSGTCAVGPPRDKVPSRYLASSKSEIYSNGLLLAPDGQLLCTCSMNKLKWYCYKELGGDPLTIWKHPTPSLPRILK